MGGAQESALLTDNLSAVLVHIEANNLAGKVRSKSYMSLGTLFALIGVVTLYILKMVVGNKEVSTL
jgi:hypothetical protein